MKGSYKFILAIAVFLFALMYFFRFRQIPAYQIPEKNSVKIIGRVTRQPYLKGSNQIIGLGPITIKTSRFPSYYYNQKLMVIGKFNRQVTTGAYSKFFTSYPAIQVLEINGKFQPIKNLTANLLKIRGHFGGVLGELFPEPHASLLMGIIFGIKSQMPVGFWEKLQQTGTLHIVVASGQNVSIIARILVSILVLVVSRKKAVVLAGFGVAAYILMAGAEPPLVRAGIMAMVAFTAQLFGREQEGTLALFLAAGLMLLVSPMVVFDLGFQLSLMATAGIIWIYPLFKSGILNKLGFFDEALSTTISAQVGVTPLIVIYFGRISLLSPLINALILWTVPLLMVMGIMSVFLGLALRPIAVVFSWFTWLLAAYFIGVVEVFGRLPGISWEVGQVSFWWAIGYYLLAGWLIYRYHCRSHRYSHE